LREEEAVELLDPYVVLGVARSASAGAIKSAFRALVKESHPDVAGPESAARFRRIEQAYRVLSDPRARHATDRELSGAFGAWRGALGAASGGADELHRRLLEHLLGRRSAPGRTLHFELVLTPAEAARGGSLPLPALLPRPCRTCRGSGRRSFRTCPACHGSGAAELSEPFEVRIPPGLRAGEVLELCFALPGSRVLEVALHVRIEPNA